MGVLENEKNIKELRKEVREVENNVGDLSTLGMSITDKFNQVDDNFDNVSEEFENVNTKILSLNSMHIEEVQTTSISLSNNVQTKIGDSFWLPKGVYIISCIGVFNNNNSGIRRIGLYPQGTTATTYKQLFQSDIGKTITNSSQVISMCRVVNINEENGITLDFCAMQSSGSALSLTGSRLEIVKLK